MARSAAATLFTVGLLTVAAAGCRETLDGSMTITEAIPVRTTSGDTLIQPGIHVLQIRFDAYGKQLRFYVKSGGEDLTLAFKSPSRKVPRWKVDEGWSGDINFGLR